MLRLVIAAALIPATAAGRRAGRGFLCASSDDFKCPNTESHCIWPTWRCDGLMDCPFGQDELDCDKRPPCNQTDTFPVLIQFFLSPPLQRCLRSSEQIYGTVGAEATVSMQTLQCSGQGDCQPSGRLCDGKWDCPLGSDELHCPAPRQWTYDFRRGPTCRASDSGRPRLLHHYDDLANKNDETPVVQRTCSVKGWPACLFETFLCDGIPFCDDGERDTNGF